MAESSWPSPSNSRVVDDPSYEKLGMSYGVTAGVVGDFTSPQLVYGDSTGMQIKVAADRYALVRGHEWYSGSTIFTKAIGANASGSTRTDLVVLRLSRTTWDVTVVVVAGTPGGGAPTPTQNVGTTGSFDLPLATVTVANGAATISAANVTYVGTHLSGVGGYRVPSIAALAYVPLPLSGVSAALTDGASWLYTGAAWVPAGNVRSVYKTVTTSRASTIVLAADPHLQMPVDANSRYEHRGFVMITSGTAEDYKMDLSIPAGATHKTNLTIYDRLLGGIRFALLIMDAEAQAIAANGNTFSTQAHWVEVVGVIVTGATPGTAAWRWSQATSGVNAASWYVDSYWTLTKLS